MPNANKRKGDDAERWVRDYAIANGFPGAERTKAGYERDAGDIHLEKWKRHGAILQVKNVVTPNWTKWFEQLEMQKDEAQADIAVLITKRVRFGAKNIQHWFAVMEYGEMLKFILKYQDMEEELRVLREQK